MKNIPIEKVFAREILDSRGNPTIEVEVTAGGITGRASVPSGASTGAFEAIELRDENDSRYLGKGVKRAVDNVNSIIASKIIHMNVLEQAELDKLMINSDGTENKSKLGANAILGVSLACAHTAAKVLEIPLYRYIGGINACTLPMPMMNILNGGKHADNNLNIQEFMIIPSGSGSWHEALQMCAEVFYSLKKVLKEKGYSTAVGDEGGFAPNLSKDEEAFEVIIEAITNAGFTPGDDVDIAIDVAATEMYEEAKKSGKNGNYYFWKSDLIKTRDELVTFYEKLVEKYPITSIEDGFAEEDWDGWKLLTDKLGDKIQLVGDDLFVTNTERIMRGIELGVANSVLIKVNQIGTLTETIEAVNMAKEEGYSVVISHRSGETEDTTIADLAVGLNAGQIKAGAPSRTDRVCKYNQLLRIEEEVKSNNGEEDDKNGKV